MQEFKVGDRVKYHSPANKAWHDKPGTVVRVYTTHYMVKFDHWAAVAGGIGVGRTFLRSAVPDGTEYLRAVMEAKEAYRQACDEYQKAYDKREAAYLQLVAAKEALEAFIQS